MPQAPGKLFDDHSRHVDRFGLLLGVTVLAVVTLSLVDLRPPDGLAAEAGNLLLTTMVSAMLLLSLRASGVARLPTRIADILVAVGIVGSATVLIADVLRDEPLPRFLADARPPLIWLMLAALAPVAVVFRLLQHRRAGGATLAGAVAGYLLIAVVFDFAYLALDGLLDEGFFGHPEPTTSAMYFSLTTITTLGYGDLSAAGTFGQFLSTAEAVIGQVYLVTFVALVVGLYARDRSSA